MNSAMPVNVPTWPDLRLCPLSPQRLDHPERTGPVSRVDRVANDVVVKDRGDEDASEELDEEVAVRELHREV